MNQQSNWVRTGAMAEAYERGLVPAIFTPWATELLARGNPQPGEQVLDVACGTGAVTRLVAEAVGETGRVVGLDVNVAMLDVARSIVHTVVPIEWCESSAEMLPYPPHTFDLVLCQQGIQFILDRLAALAQIYRVLRPGGRLALSVWRSIDHNPVFVALAAALAQHIGPEAAVLRQFALGDAEELPQLVEEAGFQEVRGEIVARTLRFPSPEEFVRRYIAGSPVSAAFNAVDHSTQAAVIADVRTSMEPFVDASGMACPLVVRIVTARR